MYRKIEEELKKWKSDYKMPLMLVGARQTGKTYILEKFCKSNFNNYVYINLDKEENIAEIFEETIDPVTIIEKIEIIKNIVINTEDTILFFDEADALRPVDAPALCGIGTGGCGAGHG